MAMHNIIKRSLTTMVLASLMVALPGHLMPAYAQNQNPALVVANDTDVPFDECDPRIFMGQQGANNQVNRLVSLGLATNPVSFLPIGDDVNGYLYNAMGYNPRDNFIYAMKDNMGFPEVEYTDIVRIGSDGIPKYYATLPNDIANANIVIGDFDPEGRYYIMTPDFVVHVLSLENNTVTVLSRTQLPAGLMNGVIIQDFGFYEGALWSIETNNAGTHTGLSIVKLTVNDDLSITQERGDPENFDGRLMFTSIFAAQNGIYGYDTLSGTFVKIDMGDGSLESMRVVPLARGGATMPGSDGAKCFNSPLGLKSEITVTKTSTEDFFVPGEKTSFEIRIANNGNWGITGIEVNDPLPPGATDAEWTCIVPENSTAACSPEIGTGPIVSTIDLENTGDFVTFNLTFDTDPAAAEDIVNTVTIVIPTDYDNALGNNTATFIKKLPRLEFTAEKVGLLVNAEGADITGAGDVINYTVTVKNDSLTAFSNVTVKDDGPLFGAFPATGVFSTIQPASAQLEPGNEATFTASYTITAADLANLALGGGVDIINTATIVVIGEPGSRPQEEVVTSTVSLPFLKVDKRAEFDEVLRGGSVPFTITLKPSDLQKTMNIQLVDTMPVGFVYVPHSASINGRVVEPAIHGRRLIFPVEIGSEAEVELRLTLAATAAVNPGIFENHAHAELLGSGIPFGDSAVAQVEVALEAVFDCGDLIGWVFNDTNRNGNMDRGEVGVSGVRLVAVDGINVLTDRAGQFHLTCADIPKKRLGSTFLLKLDPASLPSGYRILSENPRAVRLTAGKVSKINFATSIMRVVRLDINADAFLQQEILLKREWQSQLHQLIALLQSEPSILRLSYIDRTSDRQLAAKRVNSLRDTIQDLWERRAGRYRLQIESRILNQMGQGWDDGRSISWVIEP